VVSYYYEEDTSNYPGRTDLDKSVLNDHWVSQPPRKDDFKFKASAKNIYEENLFECEDGRFELDVLMSRSIRLKEILMKVEEEVRNGFQEKKNEPRPVEDYLGVIDCVVLTTLYGEEGKEIIKLLAQYPIAVIPVLVSTLTKKEMELATIKKDNFAEKWNQVVLENTQKSMDHRSMLSAGNELKPSRISRSPSPSRDDAVNVGSNNSNHNNSLSVKDKNSAFASLKRSSDIIGNENDDREQAMKKKNKK